MYRFLSKFYDTQVCCATVFGSLSAMQLSYFGCFRNIFGWISYTALPKAELFQHDNLVCVWTFQGRRLQQNRMDSLYQFAWRPRPPRQIAQEQKDDIKKNFKKYQNKFETQDKMSQSKTSKVKH